MAGKMTFLVVFAVLGFIGGIAANWAYRQLQPAIAAVLKDVMITDLLLSGVGGAVLTVFIVLIWANFGEK